MLEGLSLVQDMPSVGEGLSNILPVARKYGLSAYDAAYLELSIRRHASLATLDGKLLKAAQQAEVQVFTGDAAA